MNNGTQGNSAGSKKHGSQVQFRYGESGAGSCSKVCISTSALRTILHSNASINKRGFQGEDGSFLVGGFYKAADSSGKIVACVKEAVDGGIQTERSYTSYEFDSEYINHVVRFIQEDRHASAMQLIGMVHFHPGRMNVFSGVDVLTNIRYTRECSVGWLSGIITMQNGVEMFMYFCENRDDYILCTAVPVEVSDQEIRKLDKKFQVPRSLKEIYRLEKASLPKILLHMDDEARSSLLGNPQAMATDSQPSIETGTTANGEIAEKGDLKPEHDG